MRTLTLLSALLIAAPAFAGTDVFEKWRTPAGTLYIGARPPEGSVLLERVELVAAEAPSAEASVGDAARPLADAARDGRELMRRRAAEREAERDRDLARGLRDREPEVVPPVPSVLVVGGGFRHRRHGHFHRHRPPIGIGPSPIPAAPPRDLRLVTPDLSFGRMAPLFSAPPRSHVGF